MLADILKKDRIIPDLKSRGKHAVMEELCQVILAQHPELDADRLMEVLIERERLGSTGIGDGVAIPHGKVADLDDLLVSFGRSAQGVDFDSLDGKPAHLFFLVLAPENSAGVHLKALARIARLLKSNSCRQDLMNAADAEEIHAIFAAQDQEPW